MMPSDLGLPAKFGVWRKGQLDAVIAMAVNEKRFSLNSLPTGSGKSAIYMGLARMVGGRTLVLTSTKGLQQQLTRDFAAMGLKDVRGKANYRCYALDDGAKAGFFTGCDEGYCNHGDECNLRDAGCSYYDAVRVAARSEIVVTNYSYWMSINRYADPETLGEFSTLVLDEAHDAADALADFCAIHVVAAELHALIGEHLPPLNEGKEIWTEWADHCFRKADAAHDLLKEQFKFDKSVAPKLRRMRDLWRKLQELRRAWGWKISHPGNPDVWVPGMEGDWVAESVFNSDRRVTGALFSPVWAHGYAESYIFARIPRVVLVSATLLPSAARYLGIRRDAYSFTEHPSTFPVERRPFVAVPTVGVSRDWTPGQQRVWVNKMDSILDARPDRRGIIHTSSYDRAKLIMGMSRHRVRMVTHRSSDAREAIERFKVSPPGTVMVSPSLETGYDFPYRECEFQIVAKVPFLDTRSEVMKARVRQDKSYQNYTAALRLVQMVGRGMRAEDDFCETFVVDDNVQWFMSAAKAFLPRWFTAAYRRITGPVPPPTMRAKA